MKRRAFLERNISGLAAIGAGASIAAKASTKTEDPNVFVFPRLKFRTLSMARDRWDVLPDGDDKFLSFLEKATSIKLSTKKWRERVIDIKELGRAYAQKDNTSEVFSLPFLFMTGEGDFRLDYDEAATFKEYFKRGGFLYADDCVTQKTGDFFFKAFEREIRKVMPGHKMKPVPLDHDIFHCFYDFDKGAPKCQGGNHPDMGLFYRDRLVAFLTAGDIHCGWCASFFQPRTKEMAEASYKMGVNIVIYALTH